MAKANGGESGQHMTWQQAWAFAKSQPYELQKETIYVLNLEIYEFLAFASSDVQIEVMKFAPDYVIDLFRDKKRKYIKILDGKERIGYLPILQPETLAYLNESRHIQADPKRKKKGCHKHA